MQETLKNIHSFVDEVGVTEQLDEDVTKHLHFLMDQAFDAGKWSVMISMAEESNKKLKESLKN